MHDSSNKGFVYLIIPIAIILILGVASFLFISSKNKYQEAPILNPSSTPISNNVTNACTNNSLRVKVSPPDGSWNCEDNEKESALRVSSDQITVKITNWWSEIGCALPETDASAPRYEPNPDPNACIISDFFKNNTLTVKQYSQFGVETIEGQMNDGTAIFISSSKSRFTQQDKTSIKSVLQAISKI